MNLEKISGLMDKFEKDCELTTTTTTTTTTTDEPGCCYGATAASNEMCAAFDEDPDKCDARGKCEFRAGEDADCTLPTTTSEPWLAAKSESKTRRGRRNANSHQQEAMLFGAESTVSQAMQTQVSLSTVLLFALAAFALQQAYQCVANRNGGYKHIDGAMSAPAAYQSL